MLKTTIKEKQHTETFLPEDIVAEKQTIEKYKKCEVVKKILLLFIM